MMMCLHDTHMYDFLFGLRITNWQDQTVAPALPESILGHGPSMLQRCLDALGHAGDQGLWRRVEPRNPHELPAERREGVRFARATSANPAGVFDVEGEWGSWTHHELNQTTNTGRQKIKTPP